MRLSIRSFLFLVLATAGGCNSGDDSTSGAAQQTPASQAIADKGQAPKESPKYIACVAVLVDYDAEFPWFEDSTDESEPVLAHGESPRALFVVSRPIEYANRQFGVLMKYADKASTTSFDASDRGTSFSFEVPEDFLSGNYTTMDNNAIRHLKRLGVN